MFVRGCRLAKLSVSQNVFDCIGRGQSECCAKSGTGRVLFFPKKAVFCNYQTTPMANVYKQTVLTIKKRNLSAQSVCTDSVSVQVFIFSSVLLAFFRAPFKQDPSNFV